MARVVITGMGAVTPLGNSLPRSWEALKAGVSGIGPLTKFDASRLPCKIAGELKGFDPSSYLSQREVRRLDPFIHYAVAASVMAVEDAGFIERSAFGRHGSRFTVHDSGVTTGVIIGSSRGGIGTIEKSSTLHRLSPYTMPSSTVSMAASGVAQTLGTKGHCLGISNACASGTNAIGEAFRLVKSGHCGVVLAGGAEAPLCRFCVEGYGIAGALSRCSDPHTPRPFDRERDGFVLSEGACVLVIEDYERARDRGARIYAEIAGYGNTSDAFHMTRPDPEGEVRAMTLSMEEAGITPDDVDHISTHGTGTRIGDSIEAVAIRKVFGTRSSVIPATSAKGATGHMLAASGAFEVAAAAMSMKEGIIPPTVNLVERDPECDINVMPGAQQAEIKISISNSFGFGGVNAVVVLRAVD